MSGLSRRVAVLEASRADLVYRREAERLAQQYGGSAATHLEELRALAAAIVARYGPRPDMREVAHWMAQERGLDPNAIYAEMMALKEGRSAATNPSGGA